MQMSYIRIKRDQTHKTHEKLNSTLLKFRLAVVITLVLLCSFLFVFPYEYVFKQMSTPTLLFLSVCLAAPWVWFFWSVNRYKQPDK